VWIQARTRRLKYRPPRYNSHTIQREVDLVNGERYIKAAFAYLYIREFRRAIESFQRAMEVEPENPVYFFHASVTALRNQMYDYALLWAERAAELAPNNELYAEHLNVVRSSILTAEAMLAKSVGNWAEALRLLHDAMERDPLNEEALMELQWFESHRAEWQERHGDSPMCACSDKGDDGRVDE
jgi:tetratricopeptide (TPR) repeat protein